MQLSRFFHLTALAAFGTATPVSKNETVGPSTGHLLVVGGGTLSDRIWTRFIDLAGGPSASIIVVPTAGGEPTYDDDFPAAKSLRDLGATNVTILHTYDPQEADTEAFAAPLADADGIWFGGGRQWRLVDAYADTITEKGFNSVLARDGVIGGTSAGASIQGSFLARGDTASNKPIIGDHTVGFGYLRNTAIDQHVLVRNRHFDMLGLIKKNPELLGLALDENTALVVQGDDAEVLGASYAIVYDGTYWSSEGENVNEIPDEDGLFYFLRDGDRYDLGARKVVGSSSAATDEL